MTDTVPQQRRGHLILLAAGTVAAILLGIAATGLVTTWRHDVALPTDLHGNQVQIDENTGHADTTAKPSGLGRLVVSSVGLNVPLGSMRTRDDVIEPPGFTSAYWVQNLGTATTTPNEGTVFVAVHSLRNGGVGPGNFLIDVDRQEAKVKLGAMIMVNGVPYTVSKTAKVSKSGIGADRAVWANTPDRLVILTCLQRVQGGPSVDNIVIEATRTTNLSAAPSASASAGSVYAADTRAN